MKPFFLLCLCATLFAKEVEHSNITIPSISEQKDVIVIEPKQRAEDFSEAYEMMKRGKSPQKIVFHLSDGKSLTNVLEMKAMKNGTLLLFKINTSVGNQYELVPIENLITISQL